MSNVDPSDRDRATADGESEGASASESADRDSGSSSASKDLADGLDLMLRAARKAVKEVDLGRIEDLGRKAKQNLERLDRKAVEDLGRKAAQRLDPRRLEEIAEDAGRELLNVVERVAERVDTVVSGRGRSKPSAPGDVDESPPAPDAISSDETSAADAAEPASRPRVRIED
jgi:hypothetical protein